MRRRIERTRGGELRLRLPREERLMLRTLGAELLSLLDDDPDDPDLRRLFPPAHEDPEQEAEFRSLVRDDLMAERERAIETLRATVDRDRLTAEEADAWLRALNDARLLVGTRLDVQEDTLLDDISPRDPRAHELAVYAYLSWLQEQLVEALAGGL